MTDTFDRPETYALDNTDPSLGARLVPTLNDLRETCPVAWSPYSEGFWILSKYEDVVAAARDHQHFTVTGGILIPPTGSKVPLLPAELDPPRHTQLRKLVMKHFTEPALQQWIPEIRQIIADAFAPLLSVGRADLIRDIAHKVPVSIISLVLGTWDDNKEQLQELSAAFLAAPKDPEIGRKNALRLQEHLQTAIDARRGSPPEDILGQIVHATVDGEPLTDTEVLGLTQLLHLAGHDTTMNAIGTIVHRIIVEPGLRERLLADRSLMEPVIDEALRLHGPVWNMARTVAEEIEVRGSRMCPGEKVMLAYGAANRDPEIFVDPEAFVVNREPNRHLAFGSGRHRCLGEALARIELTLTMEHIFDTIPDIELDGEVVWGPARNAHGIASLPVRFTPPLFDGVRSAKPRD